MSETLEQRMRNKAQESADMLASVFPGDIVELLNERDKQIILLKAVLKYIEFEIVSKCCPVCGGNQCHDSACVLAAFLYPEKAKSYEYNTKDTHINEMLWQIGNDDRFVFLRDELSVAKSAG